MESKKNTARRHVLGRPSAFNLGLRIMDYVPLWIAYGVSARGSELSYLFYREARSNIISNLRAVFPEAGHERISKLALNAFRNYSRYLVDYCRFQSLDRETLFKEIVHVDGMVNVDNALERGKGLILLTAHLGNWELGGIFFGRQDIKINVLTARDEMASIDEIKERYRREHNINTIVVGDHPFAGIEAVNALSNNEVVAMLVDRSDGHGVEVPFFGRPTKFPLGPIHLARATGAPLMPAFVVSEKDGYRAVAEKLIYFDSSAGDTTESVAHSVIEVFERYIRNYPDQWYNFCKI